MFDSRGKTQWSIHLLSGWCLACASLASFFGPPPEPSSPTSGWGSSATTVITDFSDTAVQQNSPKVIEADLHAKSILRNICSLGRAKLRPNPCYLLVAKCHMVCLPSLVELGVALRL